MPSASKARSRALGPALLQPLLRVWHNLLINLVEGV